MFIQKKHILEKIKFANSHTVLRETLMNLQQFSLNFWNLPINETNLEVPSSDSEP